MDFNSLVNGNPFYVLRKLEDKPVLEIGVVKSKSALQPKYQSQTQPGMFNGTNVQQVMTIVVTVNGSDREYSDVPANVEIAAKGNETFTGSREAMLQFVDSMMRDSDLALKMMDYHKSVKTEGEKMIETLNPRYAEEKRQAIAISELERRQLEISEKLDSILSMMPKKN